MLTRNEDVQLICSTHGLTCNYKGPSTNTVYVALRLNGSGGSSIVPYAQGWEGSTVFLPFDADHLFCFSGARTWKRVWSPSGWSDRLACQELSASTIHWDRPSDSYSVVAYVKDLSANQGWGEFLTSSDQTTSPGLGDRTMSLYHEFSTAGLSRTRRFHSSGRERIYELFVRLFGNTNETRKPNGTLEANGCGKFNDITDDLIGQIAAMGFTHIWLMGVVRHATTTSYAFAGLAADETDLMKGLAGSPYAIKDYFDVAPDLAVDVESRFTEFSRLIERIHAAGLRVLVDFVGNHVARSYQSLIRPDLDFGVSDDRSVFFHPNNNFFYLTAGDPGNGPPLHLPTNTPTCQVKGDCDGLFAGEMQVGRVTGNNAITWSPSIHDWYETVKLNYGFEFTGRFPSADFSLVPPDTWHKMDEVFRHWQELGVDGFRCDMAHMIPPEFWQWSIGRARERNPAAFFMAEAYSDYFVVPSRAPEVQALGGNLVFHGLRHAGFNAIYGHDLYRTIKNIYDGENWANDIDQVTGADDVHYAENHDEVRLASPYAWAGLGANVGRAVSAILFLIGRGPILFYNGQELGIRAEEAEGFSGADGRTTLFDYWSMPEMVKWIRDRQSDANLRDYYRRLISLSAEPAFATGDLVTLNNATEHNQAAGHWVYSFLRFDRLSGQRLLVVANLGTESLESVTLIVPDQLLPPTKMTGIERLSGENVKPINVESPLQLPRLSPLMAYCFELRQT